jgi:hypothetical protein
MNVLAIDPGPARSAWCLYSNGFVGGAIVDNKQMLRILRGPVLQLGAKAAGIDHLAIEMIESFGMAVGKEVFETVFWTGRFYQAWPGLCTLVYRKEVKMHLCSSMRAKDPNIRQALIDRLGPPGKKASPGPTFGIAGDVWSALAVAVTFYEMGWRGTRGAAGD